MGLTGATGFLGAACAGELARAGRAVVCTVRPTSDMRTLSLNAPSAERVEASLNDRSALAAAFAGCFAVVHCAARASDWGRRLDFHQDNVIGTRNVVEAAASAGVRQVIHLSTTNAGGHGRRQMDELSAVTGARSVYARTKLAAERAARLHAARHGMILTILRPSAIYGPYDTKWTLPMLHRIAIGRWALVDRGRAMLTPVYVRNVTQAVCCALDRCARGTFIITDDVSLTWDDFSTRCARAMGASAKARSIPYVVARPIAELSECMGRLARRRTPPLITRYRVIRAAKDFDYACNLARRALGYEPDQDVGGHLRRCADWYHHVGARAWR